MAAAYCNLNSRGRKFAKSTKRRSFGDLDERYVSIGLPAHKAALLGDVEALKVIFFTIENSPGVPLLDRYKSTPLHLAAKSNMHHAVKWLLRYTDIDPISQAKNGETPAHVAGAQGHIDIFKVVLAADRVDKDKLLMKCDNNGLSPLHICIIKQHMSCLKMLVSEVSGRALGPVNDSGITAGHVAASVGNVEILKMIHSKAKKYLHQVAADGTAPIYFSAQEGHTDSFRYLHSKAKCNLNMKNRDGWAPVHAAAQGGHIGVIEYIVKNLGYDVIREPTKDGATPLHFASAMGHSTLVCWLVANDPKDSLVLSQDFVGDSPAHEAAENGHSDILKVLVSRGADLHTANRDGITPYSLAIRSKNPDCASFVATFIAASPKVRTRPTNEDVRLSIFDFVSSSDQGECSPYETIDGSLKVPQRKLHEKFNKPRSNSLHTSSLEVGKKLFPRKKSLPGGIPFSISNPNFNQDSDPSDKEEPAPPRPPSRRSSSGKQKSTNSSRRGSEQAPASRKGSAVPIEEDKLKEEVVVKRKKSVDKPRDMSASDLIKSLKSPDYSVIAESGSLKKKSRREMISIKTALMPAEMKSADFEIEVTEFGFRPKYSDNPLQQFKPVLANRSSTQLDTSTSNVEASQADILLPPTSSPVSLEAHSVSIMQDGSESPLYAQVNPEAIRKKRESKKMAETEKGEKERKTPKAESYPESSDVDPQTSTDYSSSHMLTHSSEVVASQTASEDEEEKEGDGSEEEDEDLKEDNVEDLADEAEERNMTEIEVVGEEKELSEHAQERQQQQQQQEDEEEEIEGKEKEESEREEEVEEYENNEKENEIESEVEDEEKEFSEHSQEEKHQDLKEPGEETNEGEEGETEGYLEEEQSSHEEDNIESEDGREMHQTGDTTIARQEVIREEDEQAEEGADMRNTSLANKNSPEDEEETRSSSQCNAGCSHVVVEEGIDEVAEKENLSDERDLEISSKPFSNYADTSQANSCSVAVQPLPEEVNEPEQCGVPSTASSSSVPPAPLLCHSSSLKFTVTTIANMEDAVQHNSEPEEKKELIRVRRKRPSSGRKWARRTSSVGDLREVAEKFGLKRVNQHDVKNFQGPEDEVTSGATTELKEKLVVRQQYVLTIPNT